MINAHISHRPRSGCANVFYRCSAIFAIIYVVYVIYCRVFNDWSFDEAMAYYGCEVHSFDPRFVVTSNILLSAP